MTTNDVPDGYVIAEESERITAEFRWYSREQRHSIPIEPKRVGFKVKHLGIDSWKDVCLIRPIEETK